MKIIPLREFLSTADEIHSFIVGWCEVIYPLYALQEKPQGVKKIIANEWWYYGAGNALGVLTWILIIKFIQIIFS